MSDKSSPPTMPASFNGINHIKLPAHSVQATHDFYTQTFPFKPLPELSHYTPSKELFATKMHHPATNLIIEVRHATPEEADAQKGRDPITYGVGTRADLQQWAEWFDAREVRHSGVRASAGGWVLACEDPDGRIVRLFGEEEEVGGEEQVDWDEFWLGNFQGDLEA